MNEKVKEYGEVLTFFIFETLAFTSFTLGNSILLYCLFSILTLAMILLFNSHRLKEMDWTYYLIFIIPLVLFGVMSGVSNFARNPDNGMNLMINLLTAVTMLIFVTLGFLTKKVAGFKISTGLMVIYGGLSVIVLISLGYAMVKYVPFYTLIYNGKYFYYEGTRFPIWDNIPFLMGFKFYDVSIQYFQLFGTMLFTSVIGLRYISPKKETKKFILYSIFAGIGLLAILFTLNKINLITDVLVIAFILFLLFIPKNGKVLKPIFYIIVGLVAVAFIIFVINAQPGVAQGLKDTIASNAFLDKLFNSNRFSTPIKEILGHCFEKENLLGFAYGFMDLEPSNFAIFDNIVYSGIFGALGLVIFMVFAGINLVKYYTKSKDSEMDKNIIVGFIGCFFLYSMFGFDSQPYAHNIANYIPMAQNAMFLITLFLVGYTIYTTKDKKEALAMETNNNEEVPTEEDEVKKEEPQEEVKDNTVEEMEDDSDEEINL